MNCSETENTNQSSAHKHWFIRHYMQDEMKMTSNIFWKHLVSIRNTVIWKPPGVFIPPGVFRFFASTKRSCHQRTFKFQLAGFIFVISHIQENNFVVQMSHSLKRDFILNEISPFWVDFQICNFVDCFITKHTHYTLTKIKKVKKA